MKRPTKAQAKALKTACDGIADYVLAIGGTVTRGTPISKLTAGSHTAHVETAAGTLTLSIYFDGWIAGSFASDRAVLLGLGDDLNRYSLKYNLQGTTMAAMGDPEGFKRLGIAHIERAVKATLRDENIVLRAGPKTAKVVEDLPIIYQGSADEWLSRPSDSGHWQDRGVVATLLTSRHPFCSRLDDDRWFVAQRSAS